MSSFPLLRLPLLALRNVTNYWNPIELYQFSKVSKKTKEISKSFSKIPQNVEVWYGKGYAVDIKYQNKDQKKHSYVFHIAAVHPICKTVLQGPNYTAVSIPSVNPSTEITVTVGEILEIFKCSMSKISLYSFKGTDDDFKEFISWINSLKQKAISSIFLGGLNIPKLRIFFKNFEKTTDQIKIKTTFSDPQVLNEPFEFSGVKFNSIKVLEAKWLGLHELMSMDFVEATLESTLITSKVINTFLKSWSKGRTHERMKKCVFEEFNAICMRTILEEVSIENPGAFDYDQIQGDLIVQGPNRKVAEIQFNKNKRQFAINVQ